MGSGIWCREIKWKTCNSFEWSPFYPWFAIIQILLHFCTVKVIQTCKTITKSHKINISHFSFWYVMVASVMCTKGCIWSVPRLSRYSPIKCQAPFVFSPLVAMDCSTATTQLSPLLPRPSTSGLLWFPPFQPALVPDWMIVNHHTRYCGGELAGFQWQGKPLP